MSKFVRISVIKLNQPSSKTFTYMITEKMNICIGQIVKVSFGEKTSLGVVRSISSQQPKGIAEIKEIEAILEVPPIPKYLCEVADWMIDYYVSSASAVWRSIIPRGLTQKFKIKKTPLDNQLLEPLLKLNLQQLDCVRKINQSKKPVLLFGITGSGKTEIYFHLIKQQIHKSQSAILLMPEILLTNQMVERVKKHFGPSLVVTHSGMTPAQRRDTWLDIINRSSANEPLVILGPRSALFAPLHNIGLIIIDESHEPVYKQNSSPYYQSSFVASQICKSTGSKLVLGSATPSILEYFYVKKNILNLVELSERAVQSKLPEIKIIDLKNEHSIISRQLVKDIEQCLKAKKQVLLFLNRRGSGSAYLCTSCGYHFLCPNCGINMRLHADITKLLCHICNYSTYPPAVCPECQKPELKNFGIGTKKVSEEIAKIFSDVEIIRVDRDNFRPNDLLKAYQQIKKEGAKIIIGTQMIGLGLDMKNIQLVGIINADTELGLADFSVQERTFQLVTQVGGRAGRRSLQGKVIIQTYQTDSPIINAIKTQDYEFFFKQELALRKKFLYPPYTYLLKLSCGNKDESTAQKRCLRLLTKISQGFPKVTVLGPVAAYPFMSGGKYWWRLILKSPKRSDLLKICQQLNSNWRAELDPTNLL